MKSYTFKSFRGGISDYENKGIEGSFKFGKGLNIRKRIDSLSCNYALKHVSNFSPTGLVRFIVPTRVSNAVYFLASDGKIYEKTSGDPTLKYTDADGDILGAAVWYDNSGNTYLYWATSTKLHRKALPGLSDWTDVDATGTFPKTLTASSYHTMKVINGALVICNLNYLAYVGYDNSFSASALNLIPGYVAKTLLERKKFAMVGCVRDDQIDESAVFSWDTDSNTWNDKQIYPVNGVNAMIDTDLPLMQLGSNGAIFLNDMTNLLPLFTIPTGGKVDPDACTSDNGLALFGVYGNTSGYSGVYSYGHKQRNHPVVLNLEYPITCDQIGSVSRVGTDMYVSYKVGSSYYVDQIDTTALQTAEYYSLDLMPDHKFQQRPVWSGCVLTTAALPASCKIEVWYKLDKNGNFIQAKLEGGATQFTTTGAMEAVFLFAEPAKIVELYAKLIPSGTSTPEIYKMDPLVAIP